MNLNDLYEMKDPRDAYERDVANSTSGFGKNSQAYRADGGANDERHDLDQQPTWYIRLNGKLIRDKAGNPYSFQSKAAANKAALTMQSKLFNKDKEFVLTTNPNDKSQGVAEDKQNSIAINGKEVDYSSLEVDGVDSRDYPDFSDAYFSSGYFTDGTPMSDEDLDQLTNTYGEMLYDKAYDSLHEASQAVDEYMNRRRFLKGAGAGVAAAGIAGVGLGVGAASGASKPIEIEGRWHYKLMQFKPEYATKAEIKKSPDGTKVYTWKRPNLKNPGTFNYYYYPITEQGVVEGLNEFAPPERGDGQENRFNFQEEFESDDGEYLIELYRNVQSRSFAVSFHRDNMQYVMYPIDGIDAGDLSDGAARYVQEIKKNAAHGSQEDFVAMGSMDLEDFIPPEQGVVEGDLDERTIGQPRVAAAKPEILSAVDNNKTITIRVRAPDGTARSFSNSNPLIMQRWLDKYGLTLPHQISSKFVYEQGALDEEVRFPYPVRSEKLGRANMELLIKAYVEPTSARTTLSFGNRILELDRQDIEAVAHYYDNLLKDDTARWNFISGVMSDPDSLTDVLVKLGRRKSQTARQPGLFQEADKKKEDDVKDVALQRAISNARASFPTAGSGFEALSKQFMQSQDDDQRSIGNIKKANRRQDQLLSQINQIDQNQTQEIDSLEKDNDSLEQRLQQLQSVNARLEKTLSTMTGRNSSSQKAKTAEPSGSRSQKSIDIIPAKSTTPDAPAPREAPAPAPAPAKPAKPAAKPAPLALPEPEAPSSMSSMTKQLTAQNPDVLEPATNFVKGSAPRFDNTGAQDVVAKDELPMFGKQQAAENKEQKPEAPEVDYDDPKWDDMVKRVGQMAKQGPRKTVWDPVKQVYKTVPVNPVKEQEPGNLAGYNAIKSVSDWAEKLKTMRELQKDVSLMTDPAAKAAVQQRINELLKFGIQQGYVK